MYISATAHAVCSSRFARNMIRVLFPSVPTLRNFRLLLMCPLYPDVGAKNHASACVQFSPASEVPTVADDVAAPEAHHWWQ